MLSSYLNRNVGSLYRQHVTCHMNFPFIFVSVRTISHDKWWAFLEINRNDTWSFATIIATHLICHMLFRYEIWEPLTFTFNVHSTVRATFILPMQVLKNVFLIFHLFLNAAILSLLFMVHIITILWISYLIKYNYIFCIAKYAIYILS